MHRLYRGGVKNKKTTVHWNGRVRFQVDWRSGVRKLLAGVLQTGYFQVNKHRGGRPCTISGMSWTDCLLIGPEGSSRIQERGSGYDYYTIPQTGALILFSASLFVSSFVHFCWEKIKRGDGKDEVGGSIIKISFNQT